MHEQVYSDLQAELFELMEVPELPHRFKLEDLPTAMAQYLAEKDKAVKAIMVNE